jgi:hypothetical protein
MLLIGQPTWELRRCNGIVRRRLPIGVGAANDTDDCYATLFLVDPIDHPVRTAAGAVTAVQWRTQLPADPLTIIEQRPHDELVCREGHRFREVLGELPPCRCEMTSL